MLRKRVLAQKDNRLSKQHILITGSSGFLGSALAVKMASLGHIVYALDNRLPSENFQKIINQLPNIISIKADIANIEQLIKSLDDLKIDFCYHFASVWSYRSGFRELYEKVNIIGTQNILQIASLHKIKRVFFASTMMAVDPPKFGEVITELTPADANSTHPYGWTKAASEKYIKSFCEADSTHPDVTILRIGGIFSDWCELPPISWLMNRWGTFDPLGRIVAGNGNTGLGYLHRDDFTDMMVKCLESHHKMKHCEVLLACPSGATTHNDLFPIVRKALGRSGSPLYIPISLAKLGILSERIGRALSKLQPPHEEWWMLNLVDKPYIADSSGTQALLNWQPSSERLIDKCLANIIKRSLTHKEQWGVIQACRSAGQIKDPALQKYGSCDTLEPNPTITMPDLRDRQIPAGTHTIQRRLKRGMHFPAVLTPQFDPIQVQPQKEKLPLSIIRDDEDRHTGMAKRSCFWQKSVTSAAEVLKHCVNPTAIRRIFKK